MTGRTFVKHSTLFLLLLLVTSCAAVRDAAEDPADAAEPEGEAELSALLSAQELNELRLSPMDRLIAAENTIPEVYRLSDDDRRDVETNSGYRIQLMTTERISIADSMSLAYYDWAESYDEMPFATIPEAYVTFRQPFYRVRVGDFRRRSEANAFLAIVREHFPGAWVVMDTIDPELVP
jgi:hypothetical protein